MPITKPRLSTNINTDVGTFTDPILVLHQGSTAADVDVGFLMNRSNGLTSNAAVIWQESSKSFVHILTNSSGAADANLVVQSYANVSVGNVLLINNAGIYVDGTIGSPGQVLASDGSKTFWAPPGGFTGGTVPNPSVFESNLVISNTTPSTSNVTGALVVAGGAGIAGNVYANVYYIMNSIRWAGNGAVFESGGTPGGSNTNIQYNNAGVFAGASNFTYTAASGNVVVGTSTSSTSTTTGALVVGGGAGISGNVYSDKVYIDKGVFWSSNSNPYGQEDFLTTTELGSITDLNITSSYDFGLVNDSSISTFYDFGSLTVQGVIEGSQIVANSIPGSKLITGTDISIGNITVTGNVTTANILPSSNITFNLGSPNSRWKDIYLSGSSLYLDNVVLSANTVGSSLQVNGVDLATIDNYDLDDISGYTDGFKQVFALTYNLANVSFGNPWQLSVAVNGIPLPAFNSNPNVSVVWQSFVFPANKGYTLASNTTIKFVEAPAPRSDIYIRKQSGTTPTQLKRYPFRPIDILMASSC